MATVSAVINKKASVRTELRQRVLDAVQALDYHPDQVARSLRVRRTHTIGILIAEISSPFFPDVIRGVEHEARARGYSLIICDSNEDPALEQTNLDTLFARRVDGVLLAPTAGFTAQDRATRRRFPVVLFDRISRGSSGSAVVTDNFGGAYDAARHLIGLGHERLSIITGPLALPNARERLEGFRQALQEASLPLREEYLRRGDFQSESGYQHGCELMRLPTPPTAVFSCGINITLGLMQALRELRVPCPERVSVVSFDDFGWAANFNPPLTTVAQATLEMGKQAVQMLLRKMQSFKEGVDGEEAEVIVLKTELRVRDSTAPPCSLGPSPKSERS